MPAAIPFAISIGGTALGFTAVQAGVAALAASLIVGSYQTKQAKKKATSEYNAAQVDRFANVVTTVAPRELVLGRVRKGGAVAFRATTGPYKDRFIAHLSIAAHEIDAVEAVYFNDEQVTVDSLTSAVTTEPYTISRKTSGSAIIPAGSTSATLAYTPASGTVTATVMSEPNFTIPVTVVGQTVTIAAQSAQTVINYQAAAPENRAFAMWDLGASGAVAHAGTIAALPELWTSAHRGEGIAKLIVVFDYNETAFPNGVPNVTVQLRGAKVYDPRTATTAWSDNPALLMRHVYQHQFFGKATVSAAEDARFIAAANACDTSHGYVVDGVTSTRHLYNAGMVVPFGTPAAAVFDDLAQAMAGMWAFAGGEMYLRAGTYTASVMTFSDSDVAGVRRTNGGGEQQMALSIAVHRERADKFNVVNARIWDEEQQYKQVGLTPLKGTALITADGQELAQEVEFPAVSYAPQALHIAGVMMRDARDPLTVQVPLKMKAYPVELFDTVSLAFSRYGWNTVPKTFIVLGRKWDRESGVIWLTLKETAAAIFTPDASFLAQGYADNTNLPNPWDIEPPGTLTISSGTSELLIGSDGTVNTRVRVSWDAIPDQRVTLGGQVEVQWSRVDSGEWTSIVLDGGVTETFITGIADRVAIIVRARTRTSLASSDWTTQQVHVVVGKSEPPSDVEVFTIRDNSLEWTAVDDLDLEGYEVRFNYGTSAAWGTAVPLHSGVITESPWTPDLIPPGQITILIKAKDFSGNYSNNPASILTNLGDVELANLVSAYDDKAAGFPGTKTNCAVSAGNLLANDSGGLFWGASGGTFWGAGSAIFWPTATYLGLEYETAYTVGGVEVGARLTLDVVITATSHTLEYRYDSQDVFWGDDADFMWERSDSASFWPPAGDWKTWPGELVDIPTGEIQFRITTQSGLVRGTVSTLTLNFDLEDQFEELDDVVISAAGTTRLPITKTYRSINNVQLTLQDNGGTAVTAIVYDKNETLGPLVKCKNSAGTLVAGLVDARIQGVKG